MRIPLMVAAAALAAPAAAKAPALHVSGWARATVPAQSGSAAYLSIHNAGPDADRLLSISTPAAASASIHSTSLAGGVMRMRTAGPQVIPPGGTLQMKPGGVHVMLMGLKAPLKAGQRLPLTLRFQRAGLVEGSIPIQVQGSNAGHHH
jgi:periplasmic copper chaperone A